MRHSFDRARQGYVNLMPGDAAPGTADTADMVQAREEFLRAGHYDPLAALLAARAQRLCGGGLVVDAGAGTGYYLGTVLNGLPEAVGLAVDLSRFALRRAARSHPRAAAIGWDIWQPLPLRQHTAALVLNVFAPRNGAQFNRILRREGALLVATATSRHLRELVPALGLLSVDAQKDARLARALSAHFRLSEREEHTLQLHLTTEQVGLLARMGPSRHHLRPDELSRRVLSLAEPVQVTASYALLIYRPR